MSQQLISAGARGGGITFLGSGSSILVQIASVVVLSRLLTPEDFGLVAMVSVFMALAYLIKDFGLPVAALQAPHLTPQQASNMFWMNTATAGGSALILTLSTPVVVAIFDEPRLTGIIPAMALVVAVSGTGAQVQVDLARRMQFGALVISDVSGQVAALAIAIVLALAGFGYWALVAQAIAAAAVTLAIRCLVSGWRPLRFRRGHGSAHLLRTGSQYGFAQLLTFVQNNTDTLIVGAALGATPLGFYNRAYQLLTAPAGRILDPLIQVAIPTLNAARAAGHDYQAPLLRVQFAISCLMTWVFAMASGSARVLIPIVLGPGWDETIPVFQVLAVGGCFVVLSTVSYWAFVLNDKSRQLLLYNLVSKPFVVTCVLVGSLHGLVGVATGYAIGVALSWPLNLWWLKRVAALRAWEFARNGITTIISGALGGVTALAVSTSLGSTVPAGTLLAALAAGSAAMLLVLVAMPKPRSQLRDSLRLVWALVEPRRTRNSDAPY